MLVEGGVMKIAIIGHKRIPSNEGGIEKGVEQTCGSDGAKRK